MDSSQYVLLGFAGLFVVFVLLVVGHAILSRGGLIGSIIRIGVIVALFVGVGWYLDRTMVPTQATVVSRREAIYSRYVWVSPPNDQTSLEVRFQPSGASKAVDAIVDVDASTYDHDGPGTAIAIRYLPLFPFIARSSTSTSFTWLQPLLDPEVLATVAGVVVSVGLLFLVARLVGSGLIVAAMALTLAWTIVASVAVVAQPFRAARSLPLDRQAVAQVLEVDTIKVSYSRHSGGSSSLVQPFDLAILQFVPSGFDHPVKAWDEVDAGSVPNLIKGKSIPIEYSSVDPRQAQIVGGTRRVLWLNSLFEVGVIAFLMLLACLIGIFSGGSRRRKSTAPTAPAS